VNTTPGAIIFASYGELYGIGNDGEQRWRALVGTANCAPPTSVSISTESRPEASDGHLGHAANGLNGYEIIRDIATASNGTCFATVGHRLVRVESGRASEEIRYAEFLTRVAVNQTGSVVAFAHPKGFSIMHNSELVAEVSAPENPKVLIDSRNQYIAAWSGTDLLLADFKGELLGDFQFSGTIENCEQEVGDSLWVGYGHMARIDVAPC